MKTILIGALVTTALAGPVLAEEEKPYTIDGYIGVTSDYRDRGLSLSDRDPTIRASVGIYHDNGFYLGGGLAAISDSAGGDAKANIFAGYGDGVKYPDTCLSTL